MNTAIAYIINSAPGVGKSTLLKNLHLRLPDGFAIIDGDDVGRVLPYQNDINWLNLIQDNIAACCSNYISYGFPNCIISFVFPVEERLKRITELLHARGFEVIHILIDCEEEEMVRRITDRNTSRMISLEKARQLNRQMKALSADFRVDTTKINPDQVAVMVIDYINNISEMKKEISR
jgi:hypothetical protein